MSKPLLFVFFLSFSSAVSEFILRPKDPPTNIETLKQSPNTELVLRCSSSGPGNQTWLFRGSFLDEAHGVVKMDGTDSTLNIASFNPDVHSGAYECYEGHLSAQVRVESDVDPPLPPNFRPCEGEEKNYCYRGTCGVDPNNKIVCKCIPPWAGTRCDAPEGRIQKFDRNTDCLIWIIIGGVIAGCLIVITIVWATYFFCPVRQCKRKDENLERGTALLEREPEAKQEHEL